MLFFQGDYWPPLPLLIFGALSFVAGCLGLILSETKGKPMTDIIKEKKSEKQK